MLQPDASSLLFPVILRFQVENPGLFLGEIQGSNVDLDFGQNGLLHPIPHEAHGGNGEYVIASERADSVGGKDVGVQLNQNRH